ALTSSVEAEAINTTAAAAAVSSLEGANRTAAAAAALEVEGVVSIGNGSLTSPELLAVVNETAAECRASKGDGEGAVQNVTVSSSDTVRSSANSSRKDRKSSNVKGKEATATGGATTVTKSVSTAKQANSTIEVAAMMEVEAIASGKNSSSKYPAGLALVDEVVVGSRASGGGNDGNTATEVVTVGRGISTSSKAGKERRYDKTSTKKDKDTTATKPKVSPGSAEARVTNTTAIAVAQPEEKALPKTTEEVAVNDRIVGSETVVVSPSPAEVSIPPAEGTSAEKTAFSSVDVKESSGQQNEKQKQESLQVRENSSQQLELESSSSAAHSSSTNNKGDTGKMTGTIKSANSKEKTNDKPKRQGSTTNTSLVTPAADIEATPSRVSNITAVATTTTIRTTKSHPSDSSSKGGEPIIAPAETSGNATTTTNAVHVSRVATAAAVETPDVVRRQQDAAAQQQNGTQVPEAPAMSTREKADSGKGGDNKRDSVAEGAGGGINVVAPVAPAPMRELSFRDLEEIPQTSGPSLWENVGGDAFEVPSTVMTADPAARSLSNRSVPSTAAATSATASAEDRSVEQLLPSTVDPMIGGAQQMLVGGWEASEQAAVAAVESAAVFPNKAPESSKSPSPSSRMLASEKKPEQQQQRQHRLPAAAESAAAPPGPFKPTPERFRELPEHDREPSPSSVSRPSPRDRYVLPGSSSSTTVASPPSSSPIPPWAAAQQEVEAGRDENAQPRQNPVPGPLHPKYTFPDPPKQSHTLEP
ncbi:unnamed protein product, partial [Sphacelaria rigidula]